MGQSHHFQKDSLPRPSVAVRKHAKTPCPGWEVARFSGATNRERQSDTWTCTQSSWTTVGTRTLNVETKYGTPGLWHEATNSLLPSSFLVTRRVYQNYFHARVHKQRAADLHDFLQFPSSSHVLCTSWNDAISIVFKSYQLCSGRNNVVFHDMAMAAIDEL